MYILKNAGQNLLRNRGRNFLILLIALVTLTAVTLSFSVRTLSNLAINRYKDSFGIQAEIVGDWEKMFQERPPQEIEYEDGSTTMTQSFEIPELSASDYLGYANSQYVKKAMFSSRVSFASETLTVVPNNTEPDEEIFEIGGMTLEELMDLFGKETQEELEEMLGGKEMLQEILDTKKNVAGVLCGYTDPSLMKGFDNGERKLENGRFPEKDGECIITNAFAEHNQLHVGDSISISGPSKSDTNEIELVITGVYADYRADFTATPLGWDYADVITTFDTVMNSGFHYITMDDAFYILNNPDAIESFLNELREKGLSEYYTLSYSIEEYETNTKPLVNISRIAEIFTFAAAIIGTVILLLLSIIQVRERKYEIGVLRAMGMKKSDVARGMIYESLLMMGVCFAASVVFGLLLTKPVAVSLLGDLTDIAITLPPVSIGLSAVIAFVLSILSGLCAVFAVMRHEPMNILIERN